ncbi:MAG: hypothetical protein PVJ57_21200 [Phycisphaerae bacterium]|jgi:hypothetical protein
MVRSIGAQLGLLAFGLAILAGLYAGNSPITILTRSLLIMVVACVLGQIVGWSGKLVLRDHLQRRKLALDREHCEAMLAMSEDAEAPEPAAAAEEG